MKKIDMGLVLIVVLIIGFMGIYVLTSNSLDNSPVMLPDGWKINNSESMGDTLVYSYNNTVYCSISTLFEEDDITYNGTETRNIDGVNVKYKIWSLGEKNLPVEGYHFQKNGKYYELVLNVDYDSSNDINWNKKYRTQIDNVIKSIIKTI